MNPEEFEKLRVIALGKTDGNDPTGYTEIQNALLPYISDYHTLLWLCFFGTLCFVTVKHLLLPFFKKEKKS